MPTACARVPVALALRPDLDGGRRRTLHARTASRGSGRRAADKRDCPAARRDRAASDPRLGAAHAGLAQHLEHVGLVRDQPPAERMRLAPLTLIGTPAAIR